MRLILLAVQLSVAQGVAQRPTPAIGDSAIRANVDRATLVFLTQWQYAWQDAQHEQPLPTGEAVRDADLRTLALHCHWIATPLRIRSRVITGEERSHATCPIWYPLDAPPITDERHSVDAALSPAGRFAMRPLRYALRALLDSAALALPGDARIAGQRVRFALDAGDVSGAASAAASCSGEPVRCGLLRGFVRYRAGDVRMADSIFTSIAQAMRDDERCAWNDVRMLLDADTRRAYTGMSCEARADFEARLWWLSDPLYLEPGNERRAEHVARKVWAALLAPLGFDGRQHWRPKQGGEAVTESLLRYGWPSQMYWGGPVADRGHDSWLRAQGADTAAPYVVREYSRDRLHTLPRASALQSPFQATPDDWRLNAPGDDDDWWPVEHFARDRSRIVSLPIGQVAMLRRRDATRFVWAGDLDSTQLARQLGSGVTATLFASRAVGDMPRIATSAARVGRPLVLDAALSYGATLVGIEIPGDNVLPAARTRFGVMVPEPLNALRGARALSPPLLFEPPDDDRPTLNAEDAVRRMFGTTTFRKARRIGIYWEAYGFTAADDVTIEVRMDREDRPGVLARVGGVFGLSRDASGSLGIQWREALGSSRAIQQNEGDVPLQLRSIILDVSRLAPGTYRLRLSSTLAGAPAVTSERALVLR